MQQHLISTLKAEVSFNKKSHYLGLQNDVAQTIHIDILPRLEKILDALCDEKTLLRIDRLELDLGNLEMANWEHAFTEKFLEVFEKSIAKEIAENNVMNTSVLSFYGKQSEEKEFNDGHGWDNEREDAAGDQGELKKLNREVFDSMLGYLETGSLPWYIHKNFRDFFNDFVASFKIIPPVFIRDFLVRVYQNPAVIKRWNYQLNADIEEVILDITGWKIPLQQLSISEEEKDRLTKLLFENINFVTLKIKNDGTGNLKTSIRKILGENEKKIVFLERVIADLLEERSEADSNPEMIQPKAFQLSDPDLLEPGSADLANKTESSGTQYYFIENAGLIILYPFLHMLFEHCGYTADNRFKDDQAAGRAVLLTQFMVTGEIAKDETGLLLNKLLCGLPVDFVVDFDVDISEENRQQARDVVEAAITYWDKLGKTSIEGLQNSFLKRSGKLIIKEESINLLVERQGMDILLGSLPWTISIVKTPFMQIPIMTEW